jgi:Coenzyme PQQ synthesis protein D (PqqD)
MQGRKLRIQQSRNVKVRNVDGEIFLIDDVAGNIHHTNLIGLAIWQLLRQPTKAAEVVSLLCAAFPDRPRNELRSDYLKLEQQLRSADLIKKIK